ncbi:hypothetical protein K438DRAFT_1997112 [Mycena galopus ATCC 62051]|nr:hypothetical protein K438DRAFT_1997112 [Mycena galopus ATCC 62051]
MPTTSSEANAPLNTAPITHREMMAVLGAVDELVLRAARPPSPSSSPIHAQVSNGSLATLPKLFARVDVADRGDWYANLPDGRRDMWVVYVGREPGVYDTNEAADFQVKGCPGQQYWKRTSKRNALNFYAEKYALREVQKWVQEL